MAELVDALHSGCSGRMLVEVRVLFWARFKPVFGYEGRLFPSCNHMKKGTTLVVVPYGKQIGATFLELQVYIRLFKRKLAP